MTRLAPLFSFEKSKLRKALFLYFFTNPEQRHYVRELAQILKVDATNLSRELKRLEEKGLFRSEVSGHQKYFSLNKSFPLYQELKSVVDKTIGVPALLKDILADIPGVKRAFIYGSFAKGTTDALSDIDVCLIVEKGKFRGDKVLLAFNDLEEKLRREISNVFYNEQEWANGLKKKNSFLIGLEKGNKIELIKQELD